MQVKKSFFLFLTEDFSFNEVLIKTVRSVGCEVPQHLPQADISKSTEWMHIFLKFYALGLALKNEVTCIMFLNDFTLCHTVGT